MKKARWPAALLALALTIGMLFAGFAEEEIVAKPAEEAVEALEIELPGAEDAAAELAGPEYSSVGKSVKATDAGSMVTITKPADGATVKTGDVELWCRFSNSAFSGSADSWKLMPMTVEVLRGGTVIDSKSLSNYSEFSFSGEGAQYATLKLNDPGTYTIRASVPGSPDKWSSVTFTATDGPLPTATPTAPPTPSPTHTLVPDEKNPGYWLIPDQTEYTVELGTTDTLRVYYTESLLYRYETHGVSFRVDKDAYIQIIDTGWEGEQEKVDGLWQRRFYVDLKPKMPGTATLSTYVYTYDSNKNKIPYSLRNVTLHVLPDPNATPVPTLRPTATPEPTATPAPASLNDAQVTLKKSAYTYTGKALKPAVKVRLKGKVLRANTDYTVTYGNNRKPGKATVTVRGKGKYAGTQKASFAIKPMPVKGLKLTAGAKRLTASWTKDGTVSGYEVQYGLKKDSSGAKTVTVSKAVSKKVIRKLTAGETYYVRVRSYKTVGKTKKYVTSKWSAYKKIKVK